MQGGHGLVRIGKARDFIAATAQQALKQKDQGLIVVHIHDMAGARGQDRFGQRGFGFVHAHGRQRTVAGSRVAERKVQREATALAQFAVYIDSAAMGAHHAMYDREAQACALADRFGGEKRLEDAPLGHCVHAGAVVLHHKYLVFGHGQTQALALVAVGSNAHGSHLDDAALTANGLHGVVAEIEQRLFHLSGVGQQRRQIVGLLHLQLYGGRQGHAQQASRVGHDFLHLNRTAFGQVIAAEGQNLAHQIAGAATGFFDLAQAFHGSRVAAAIGLGQLHITQDCAHDVVEVVGNPAGHGAYGLHLVGFAQLGFQRIALGFGAIAAGQVARKDGGGVAAAVVLEGDADFHGNLTPRQGQTRHLAQHGLCGQRGKSQRPGGIG